MNIQLVDASSLNTFKLCKGKVFDQKINSGLEFTFLKAPEAHLSRIPFVSRHLFSLKSFAAMHALKVPRSSLQN